MNSALKTVSVVMPIHNDPDRGAQTLEALLKAQGSREIEIIVVDDGSTDRTPEMINAYPVQLLRNSVNKGQSYCRNIGAETAKGTFILFVDSDVIVPEDTFETLDQFISTGHERNPAGMLAVLSLQHPNPDWISQCYNIVEHIHSATPKYTDSINCSCFLVRKSTFEASGGFDPEITYLEDTELGSRFRGLGYYFQKGPLQIVHLKKVNWKWLYLKFFLAGASLSSIGIERPISECTGMFAKVINSLALQHSLEPVGIPTRVQNSTELPPKMKNGSPFVRSSVLSGFLLFFCLVIWLLGGEKATQHALMGWGFLLIFMGINFQTIFQVNRNPFFFLFCSHSFIVFALSLGVGFLFGRYRKRLTFSLRFWRS